MSDRIISPPEFLLRDVVEADLPIFFEQQADPAAIHMAAFTPKDPTDREAFMAHWAKILANETIVKKTILFDGQVAGQVASFERFGDPEVTYYLGREYWGKGLATRALRALLEEVTIRPIYGRAAADNIGSIRVLEKCGFTVSGHEMFFANGRGEEIEEVILLLKE